MITGTVEAVSKNGKGFLMNGKWFNPDKSFGKTFSPLAKGDSITFEANDNWVTALNIVGKSAVAVATPSKTYSATPSSAQSGAMSRGAAVKAVGSLLGALVGDNSAEESLDIAKPIIESLATYIETGKFEIVEG